MKILLLVIGLSGLLIAPATQAGIDGSVKMTDPGTGGYDATIITGLANYGALNSTFRTFCVEETEYFNPGSIYKVSIDTAAIRGGVGAVNGRDEISMATAYLYSQFRSQALGFTDASSIQQAVWYLEQELVSPTQQGLDLANGAITTVGSGDANGAFGVVVINLIDDNGNNSQSQLAIAVPEPSTVIAGALLLLPFGASVLRTVRRNHAA